MNKQQFADLLTCRQYGEEITKEECRLARGNNLLVAFGYSDDGLRLRGLIDDDYSAYQGTNQHFAINVYGRFVHLEDLATMILLTEFGVKTVSIQAIWQPTTLDASWLITTDDVPFATFDIFEDDELFCRGIVIEKADILAAIANPST